MKSLILATLLGAAPVMADAINDEYALMAGMRQAAPEVFAVALDLNMALASQCAKAVTIAELTRDSELFALALAYTNGSNGRNAIYKAALANIRCSETV